VNICNEKHRLFVAEQFREIGQNGTTILASVGRDTAHAIAPAALTANLPPFY